MTHGKIHLDILQEEVQVFRDEHGVPHIFAGNESDLFKAVGYVTAQDRLWQMDLNRRIASGRLAEIFGEAAVENDKYVRYWGFHRLAQQIADSLSTPSRFALEAYSDGVNAFIADNSDRLPLEFSLLGYSPEPWKPEDTIAFSRFMAWKLSFSWYVDIVLHQLVQKVGERKAREVFPDYPKSGPVIVAESPSLFWNGVQGFAKNGLAMREFLNIYSAQLGSNSWVVSGKKSLSGKPLLANDPHLEITAPSVWYEMHLSGGDINSAGVVLPGTPAPMIGHNENIAWGLTNGMTDDVDFFLEKINPDNKNQYSNGREWVDFDVVEETILVKDANPVTFKISISRNGPIISDVHPYLEDQPEVITFRWTGHRFSDEFLTVLKLQKAQTWDDFTDAIRHFAVPAQNFVFASADGDIGYYLAGRVPIRRNSTGVSVHRGWLQTGQWYRDVPFEKMPHMVNPPENFIVTANNKIVDDRYPYYLTNLWEPPNRAARIRQMLTDRDSLTLDDFKNMQSDVVSLQAKEMLPTLLEHIRTELDTTSDMELRTLYDLVKTWDGSETPESVAAAIFNAFFLKLIENTFQDEMGEDLFQGYTRLSNVPSRVISSLFLKKSSSWFDNIETQQIETKHDIIVQSFADAGRMLAELAGDNISNWKWGELHTLTMSHPLGRRKPLDMVFNLGPYSRGGSKMTVNNGEYRLRAPFKAIIGASTRQLVDLSEPHHAYSVITSGQSGHPLSEHYKDQAPLWLEGKVHPMIMDRMEISQTAPQRLLLVPESNN
ncbi:MAG: penicillin acylase family protein [bacterium]